MPDPVGRKASEHEQCHEWATDAYDHGYADGLAEQIRALAEGADERRKVPGVPDDLTALAGRRRASVVDRFLCWWRRPRWFIVGRDRYCRACGEVIR